jgi:hypothetical protein
MASSYTIRHSLAKGGDSERCHRSRSSGSNSLTNRSADTGGARNPRISQRSQSSVSTLPVPTRSVVNGPTDRTVRFEPSCGALRSRITFMARKVEYLSLPPLTHARCIAAITSGSLLWTAISIVPITTCARCGAVAKRCSKSGTLVSMAVTLVRPDAVL